MIVDNNVKIKIVNRNIRYYKLLFKNIKIGDVISIPVLVLQKNSAVKIKVKCDICGQENKISNQKYNKNIDKYNLYTCNKCFNYKNKKTSLEKYGVENFNNRLKAKNTSLEKYGVENVSLLDRVKVKKKFTTLKNYNVENPSQSDEIKIIIKETNFNKRKNKYKNLISINNNIFEFYCEKCDVKFKITRELLKNRELLKTIICPNCNPVNKNISGKETQLINFIKENYNNEIIKNSRKTISPYELDIYLPKLNLAFEFNGLYWHNEVYKENNYHKMKSELCEENGIQLIHVWEDDWSFKEEIVKSMILNKLGKTLNKIYARKTEVKEINDNKLIRKFLETNHIQGFVGSNIKLGLFYNGELVSLMIFGKERKFMNTETKEGYYELFRFCNNLNINVVGGASKLFKYFIRNYNFNEIVTYADRSYSNGNLYKELGFEFIHKTQPNYYYIIDGIRHYRFGFRKNKLISEGYDSNKTEHEIMLERKIYRIFNAGNYKFKYIRYEK